MEAHERNQAPATGDARDQLEKKRRRQAPEPGHDQDSEPPRTARPPGSNEIDEEWGRQEGC